MKSDIAVRELCVRVIKKSTIQPYDFRWTKFFETELISEIKHYGFALPELAGNELPIAQTIIEPSNWTFITTRQIITCIDGLIKIAQAEKVVKYEWGDFKGYKKTAFVLGYVELADQQKVELFIETGRASMVIIYAVMRLVGQRTQQR